MTIHVTPDRMTSDQVPVYAGFRPDAAAGGDGTWAVSWIPERLYGRAQARAALALAEHVAGDGLDHADPVEWTLQAQTWAAELGLTAEEALARIRRAVQEPSATGKENGDA